jgi:GAF domain-containing protein
MTDHMLMDSTDAFAELGRINFRETTFDNVLAQVAGLALRTIPDAAQVSVTLVGVGGAHTATYTGEQALRLDRWQYEYGHGPCLAAAAANITVPVTDMAGESRWPDWAEYAIRAGMHSAVSVGLPLCESVTGALNVYATDPHAFDGDAVILAQIFAGYAAVAMANTHLYGSRDGLAQHMRDAMDSRAIVERATGIIMADRRCASDEAFAILAKISTYAGRNVADVAVEIVAGQGDFPTPVLR